MPRDRSLKLKLRAVDKMSRSIDRVQSKFPKLTRSIKKASRVAQIYNQQTKRMNRAIMKTSRALRGVGRGLTTFVTLPLVAAGVASAKFFGDFEQGLLGIKKTTGIGGKALERLGQRFDQLSTEIPVTTQEMLELGQAGGQLGIKGAKNIENFTLTMAKLSRASDVAGEGGAKSISRILAVTGDGVGKIENFSSALVDLGNNAAASESEILEVATRVAGQVGRFDVASDSVLGISTALKALGKRSESAGSVVGRSFDAIDQAIKKGGDRLKILEKLTGLTGDSLKREFETNAAGVFRKFVEGLSKVEKGEGNLVGVMGSLDLSGVRINDVLGTLAKRPEVLATNMDRATKAFARNKALQEEFEIQTKSFNSSMQKLTNTFTSLLRMVGAELAPAISALGDTLKGVFNFLRNNPTLRTMAIVFGVILAVLGPLLLALGVFLAMLPSIAAGAAVLGVSLLPLTATIVGVTAAIAAAIAITIALAKNWDSLLEKFAGSSSTFLNIIGFIMAMVDGLGKMLGFLGFALSRLSDLRALGAGFKEFKKSIGFGSDTGALGPEKGAARETRGLGQGPLRETEAVKGAIDVSFLNLPEGSRVRSQNEGPLDLNVGFAGGLQ